MKRREVERELKDKLRGMPWRFKFRSFRKGEGESVHLVNTGEKQEERAKETAVKGVKEMEEGDILPIPEMDTTLVKVGGKIIKSGFDFERFTPTEKKEEISEQEAMKLLTEVIKERLTAQIPNQAIIEVNHIQEIRTHQMGELKLVGIHLKNGDYIEIKSDRGLQFTT